MGGRGGEEKNVHSRIMHKLLSAWGCYVNLPLRGCTPDYITGAREVVFMLKGLPVGGATHPHPSSLFS